MESMAQWRGVEEDSNDGTTTYFGGNDVVPMDFVTYVFCHLAFLSFMPSILRFHTPSPRWCDPRLGRC